jgi:hypothetical protein
MSLEMAIMNVIKGIDELIDTYADEDEKGNKNIYEGWVIQNDLEAIARELRTAVIAAEDDLKKLEKYGKQAQIMKIPAEEFPF